MPSSAPVPTLGWMSIEVSELVKHFRVHQRGSGLRASLHSLVRRERVDVHAVDGVSFTIAPGEVVGFLGPNGAGKTTTLKCLSGLLHPTSGTVRVLGHEPFRRDAAYLSRIVLLMGQRNSLFWDLPALDAFEVDRTIDRVPQGRYRATLDELVDLLDLEPLLHKQVRVLRLGERTRCELAASLLHGPEVLFLDEPTLGLDVSGRAALRGSARTRAARGHRAADQPLHGRRHRPGEPVLVIDDGTLLFDGDLAALVERHHRGGSSGSRCANRSTRPGWRSSASWSRRRRGRHPAGRPRKHRRGSRPACPPTCPSTTSRSRTRRRGRAGHGVQPWLSCSPIARSAGCRRVRRPGPLVRAGRPHLPRADGAVGAQRVLPAPADGRGLTDVDESGPPAGGRPATSAPTTPRRRSSGTSRGSTWSGSGTPTCAG